jgi:four helix bundle protein
MGEQVQSGLYQTPVFALSECDETIVHLDFLFETNSLQEKELYDKLKGDYNLLSKRINKFIQWVEENHK